MVPPGVTCSYPSVPAYDIAPAPPIIPFPNHAPSMLYPLGIYVMNFPGSIPLNIQRKKLHRGVIPGFAVATGTAVEWQIALCRIPRV